MAVKLLTKHHLEILSTKGGCTGSPESIHVKMPHCWKSHALAHLYVVQVTTQCCRIFFILVVFMLYYPFSGISSVAERGFYDSQNEREIDVRN